MQQNYHDENPLQIVAPIAVISSLIFLCSLFNCT